MPGFAVKDVSLLCFHCMLFQCIYDLVSKLQAPLHLSRTAESQAHLPLAFHTLAMATISNCCRTAQRSRILSTIISREGIQTQTVNIVAANESTDTNIKHLLTG